MILASQQSLMPYASRTWTVRWDRRKWPPSNPATPQRYDLPMLFTLDGSRPKLGNFFLTTLAIVRFRICA